MMRVRRSTLVDWLKRERGASLVEYALLVALLAVVAIGAITLVGGKAEDDFQCLADELDEPEIRHRVLEKVRLDSASFSVLEAKFASDCL